MKLSTNDFGQAIIISVIKTKPSKPDAMSMLKFRTFQKQLFGGLLELTLWLP